MQSDHEDIAEDQEALDDVTRPESGSDDADPLERPPSLRNLSPGAIAALVSAAETGETVPDLADEPSEALRDGQLVDQQGHLTPLGATLAGEARAWLDSPAGRRALNEIIERAELLLRQVASGDLVFRDG